MEAKDIFQNNFKDDSGRVFKIISVKDHLNVIIDGKPFFESEMPYKLVKGVRHFFGIYNCIQSCNGTELKIFFSKEEHDWIAMTGVINANLCVMN